MKVRSNIYNIFCMIITVAGSVIMAYLSYYSFKYSYYMTPFNGEHPIEIKDNIFLSAGSIIIFIILITVVSNLEKKIKISHKKYVRNIIFAVTVCIIVAMCFVWVQLSDRYPQGDQIKVISGAEYARNGQFSFFDTYGYFGMYPQNLPLCAMYETVFTFAHGMKYQILEYFNIFFISMTVLAGALTVQRFSDKISVCFLYCLLMIFCLPLVFYSSWIYGDIPSIAFMMTALYFYMLYEEKEKIKYLIIASIALTIALIFRKNTLIFVVALILTAIMLMVKKKKYLLLIAVSASVILSFVTYKGVELYYETVSGYEIGAGMPTKTWIALGLMDDSGEQGWYFDYAVPLYYECDAVTETINEKADNTIRERLKLMMDTPEYFKDFFKAKILKQWNLPDYQSMFFAGQSTEWEDNNEGTMINYLYKDGYNLIMTVLGMLQVVIYFGMFLYYFLGIHEDKHYVLKIAVPLYVIGGFMFSIMWEAKARYILPYYIMMFPFAVIGYDKFIFYTNEFIIKKKRIGAKGEK